MNGHAREGGHAGTGWGPSCTLGEKVSEEFGGRDWPPDSGDYGSQISRRRFHQVSRLEPLFGPQSFYHTLVGLKIKHVLNRTDSGDCVVSGTWLFYGLRLSIQFNSFIIREVQIHFTEKANVPIARWLVWVR